MFVGDLGPEVTDFMLLVSSFLWDHMPGFSYGSASKNSNRGTQIADPPKLSPIRQPVLREVGGVMRERLPFPLY